MIAVVSQNRLSPRLATCLRLLDLDSGQAVGARLLRLVDQFLDAADREIVADPREQRQREIDQRRR